MFSAMHFIYYINTLVARKVNSIYLNQQHITYYVCGGRWVRTSDIEITSPLLESTMPHE